MTSTVTGKGFTARCAGGNCVEDECYGDDDCSKGVCICAVGSAGGYFCLPGGDCRTDAECGEQFCSPTFDLDCGPYHGVVAYRCHTSRDTCLDDAECRAETGVGWAYCAFHPEIGAWACGQANCKG